MSTSRIQLSKHKVAVLFSCLAINFGVSQSAYAQLGEWLKGVIRIDTPSNQQNDDSKVISAAELLGYKKPSTDIAPTTPLFSTRQQLLDAVQKGDLSGIHKHITTEEEDAIVNSVLYILMTEYNVPPVRKECYGNGGFKTDVMELLKDITKVTVNTLTDKAPDFSKEHEEWNVNAVDKKIKALQKPSFHGRCDNKVMGRDIAHPYRSALVSLAIDYSKATQTYVDEERARRKKDYQEEQARIKKEKQRLIDAEAARINAEEQRRIAKEKARVGG